MSQFKSQRGTRSHNPFPFAFAVSFNPTPSRPDQWFYNFVRQTSRRDSFRKCFVFVSKPSRADRTARLQFNPKTGPNSGPRGLERIGQINGGIVAGTIL